MIWLEYWGCCSARLAALPNDFSRLDATSSVSWGLLDAPATSPAMADV
jgi:hypothetical protein